MRAVLQRVADARVESEGVLLGKIGNGLLILLGVIRGDGEEEARLLAEKIVKLRIFSDEEGRLNRSLVDVSGGLLIVSNFTLAANYRKGNRPDYFDGAEPKEAERLYEYFIEYCRKLVPEIGCGSFGADMQISMTADGPVTIVMDSDVLKGGKTK